MLLVDRRGACTDVGDTDGGVGVVAFFPLLFVTAPETCSKASLLVVETCELDALRPLLPVLIGSWTSAANFCGVVEVGGGCGAITGADFELLAVVVGAEAVTGAPEVDAVGVDF